MTKRVDQYSTATPATGDTLIGIDVSDTTDSSAGTVKQFAFTDLQPRDATLTALAAFNTNGLVAQTAADTFVGRTLTGTTNRLTVTNGDGVAGAPTFDISSSYVGQSTITTLGTIGTGVWQGTIIASTSGGTGVNNAGTLTNASNTTITGGGTIALGGFTLTVPATGSAALLATANTFTAAQSTTITDAGTNTTTTLLTLDHESSGTPAASFGTRILWNLQDNTTATQNAAAMDVFWTTVAHASHVSAIGLSTSTGGAAIAERLRIVDPPGLVTLQKQASFAYSELTAQSFWITGVGRLQLSCTDSTNGVNITSGLVTAGTGNSANLVLRAGSTFSVQTLLSDAGTNTAPNAQVFRHNSSATPAAGFGMVMQSQLQSSTTADTVVADDTLTWVVATHASRTVRRVHAVYDTASRETFREESSGSAPMIGFLGAAAVVRQTAGADLTNNVTSGGSNDTITNWTDLTTYATDAAAIRNAVYQLARTVKQDHDALRLFGFLT